MSRQHHHPAVDAVSALIRTRPDIIDTDDGPIRITQPCLLQMLHIHLHSSTRGAGARGKGAGTMPLNGDAWDLLVEIRHNAYTWADTLGIDHRPYTANTTHRPGKPWTPPDGRLLRAVAIQAETTARVPIADAITTCARRWARLIEEMLAGQPEQRGIRGAECPQCVNVQPLPRGFIGPRLPGPAGNWAAQPTRSIIEDRDDGTGRTTTYRVPAIVLITAESDTEPTLCCLGCGWHAPIGAVAHAAGITGLIIATSDTPNDHELDDSHSRAA